MDMEIWKSVSLKWSEMPCRARDGPATEEEGNELLKTEQSPGEASDRSADAGKVGGSLW